jgi:hypothetical protein
MKGAVVLLGVAFVVCASAADFRAQLVPDRIHPAPQLTDTLHLSDFNPLLRGTPGDTEVYVFAGSAPGGALLVLGGAHANEIAGVMTAVLLVETLAVQAGTVYVIAHANASAATHAQPREAHSPYFEITTPTGIRRFRSGSRFTNPRHQALDPAVFRHPASPAALAGREARNLNRAYPGVRDGTLTERVAWSIVELIRSRQIDLAFDLHEAPPDRDIANTIVVPEISQDLASQAAISLQLDGWDIRLEASSHEFRGLSHREWADATATRPFLMETTNPAQGPLRSRADARTAVTGLDANYLKAAAQGLLAVPYDAQGIPLEVRVARNCAAIAAVLELHNTATPQRAIRCNWPDAASVRLAGLGAFLQPARESASPAGPFDHAQ